MKYNCYTCVYRGELPWDTHSYCKHPSRKSLKVKGDPVGIRGGWFNWPYNFEPIWLEECNGYSKIKEGEV